MSEKEFREKLSKLLEEYAVEISWDYADCSDIFRVYNKRLSFDVNPYVAKRMGLTVFSFQTMGARVDWKDLKPGEDE